MYDDCMAYLFLFFLFFILLIYYTPGITFVLTILNQLDQFASLNWFKSVVKSCDDEISTTMPAKGLMRKQLEPSIALKMMKLEQYKMVKLIS